MDTDKIKEAAKSIGDYLKEHPEVLEKLQAELPAFAKDLLSSGKELQDRVPEKYRASVEDLLTRTEALAAELAARQLSGSDAAAVVWKLDAAKAEAMQYEAIAATMWNARFRAVSALIGELLIKAVVIAAMAAI